MIGCIGIQMCVWLACPEGDDAPDRIVRRDADGDAIPGNHFDAEAAHPAAQLGQHFMAGVALHTVEAPAVDCHDRALHVDEIVLAQTASDPFLVTNIVPSYGRAVHRNTKGRPAVDTLDPRTNRVLGGRSDGRPLRSIVIGRSANGWRTITKLTGTAA